MSVWWGWRNWKRAPVLPSSRCRSGTSRPRQPDRVPAKLAAFLPKGAAWVRSEAFNQEVTGGRYTGEFYVDVGADRVYFDTVDPSVPASTGP